MTEKPPGKQSKKEECRQRAHTTEQLVKCSSRSSTTLKFKVKIFQGERLVRKEAESGAFFFYLVPRNWLGQYRTFGGIFAWRGSLVPGPLSSLQRLLLAFRKAFPLGHVARGAVLQVKRTNTGLLEFMQIWVWILKTRENIQKSFKVPSISK